VSGLYRHMAGQAGNCGDPARDLRVAGQTEAAFMSNVRISIEADVGEARRFADQESPRGKMLVHQRQGRLPGRALCGELLALRIVQPILTDEVQPEAERSDVGLVIILLEEHPAEHVGAIETVRRDQRRSFR
jgi:hypothetical protein